MAILKTVRVVAGGPRGYRSINETDFDAKRHKRWTSDVPAPGGPVELPGFDLAEVVKGDAKDALIAQGLSTPVAILDASDAKILAVKGVGARLAERLREYAAGFVEEL